MKSKAGDKSNTDDQSGCLWMPDLWYPVYLGFCPSEEEWDKLMSNCKLKGAMYPTTESTGGIFSSFISSDTDEFYTFGVVTISEKAADYDATTVCGIIVHESVHAFQFMCDVMGERFPSKEFEAYGIQSIFQFMEGAFSKTRKWGDGKKKQAPKKDRATS